jgi:hypothetical protein
MGVYTMAVKNVKESFKNNKKLIGAILVSIAIGVFAGLWIGWYQATGTYIFSLGGKNETILPPVSDTANQTFRQISEFIQSDITSNKTYEEGFNCVDYALEVSRNAEWKGLDAEIIGLKFGDNTVSHCLIAFYTKDRGYQFYEPQTNKLVSLNVGDLYYGKKVTEIDQLMLDWKVLETLEDSSGNISGN